MSQSSKKDTGEEDTMTKLLRQEERTRDIVRGALEDAKRPPSASNSARSPGE
jgi:hypothetical protein